MVKHFINEIMYSLTSMTCWLPLAHLPLHGNTLYPRPNPKKWTSQLMKLSLLAIFLMLCGAMLLVSSCGETSEEVISSIGTVTYVDSVGGFYGIISDDGENYDSIDLGSEFQEEGLRIRFEAKLRDDIRSIHMWGKVIEITKIEKLEGD